jgi:hypothetical protein
MDLLFQQQGEVRMAAEHYRWALAIFEAALGLEHPHTALVRRKLAAVAQCACMCLCACVNKINYQVTGFHKLARPQLMHQRPIRYE